MENQPIVKVPYPTPQPNTESPQITPSVFDLDGLISTVSAVPTYTPRKFSEQFVVYASGSTYRFYWYDTSSAAWRYSPIGPVTESTLSLSDVTTDDVSITAHGFAPKAPNDTTKFLRGDATWAVPASGSSNGILFGTVFEASGRFSSTNTGAGAVTFGSSGAALATGGVAGTGSIKLLMPFNANAFLFKSSPKMTQIVRVTDTSANAGAASSGFMGIGNLTVSGTGHTFTGNHIGFKIVGTAGVHSLYATQADGTETASSALTTVVFDDVLELILVVNGTASVDYYWRKNGGTLSSATNLATHLPTADVTTLQWSASENSTAFNFAFTPEGISYQKTT